MNNNSNPFPISLIAALAIVIVLFASVGTSWGQQSSSQPTIDSLFSQTAGIVNPARSDDKLRFASASAQSTSAAADMRAAVRAGIKPKPVERERFAPGEEPLFMIWSNIQIAKVHDTVDIKLYPTVDSARDLYIYVQLLKPGNDGEFDNIDNVEYFPADTGDYGHVANLRAKKAVNLQSYTFNTNSKPGRYTFNVIVLNSGNGRLVQQVIYEVFLVNAGHWGRTSHTTDSTRPYGMGYLLVGKFPIATPLYYAMVSEGDALLVSSQDERYVPRSDGSSVILPGFLNFSRTTPLDFVVWNTADRYAYLYPGYVQDVPPQF